MVPDEGIEPPTFGLQNARLGAGHQRAIADYWFADSHLRDIIVDVR